MNGRVTRAGPRLHGKIYSLILFYIIQFLRILNKFLWQIHKIQPQKSQIYV